MYHEIPNLHSRLLATDVTGRKYGQDIPRSVEVIATMKSKPSAHETTRNSIKDSSKESGSTTVTNRLKILQTTADDSVCSTA